MFKKIKNFLILTKIFIKKCLFIRLSILDTLRWKHGVDKGYTIYKEIARKMAEPIRRELDGIGWGGQLFKVEEL